MKLTLVFALVILAAVFVLASSAMADPGTYPTKWSQTPYADGTSYNNKPVYLGWDEISWQDRAGVSPYQHLADDWHCTDNRPVTDIHWWGSYINWQDPVPYSIKPIGYWFGIYSDVPVGQNDTFSHPGQLLWEYSTTSFVEQFVGYDRDPGSLQITDSTFQYNVYLPEDKWFTQTGPDNVYGSASKRSTQIIRRRPVRLTDGVGRRVRMPGTITPSTPRTKHHRAGTTYTGTTRAGIWRLSYRRCQSLGVWRSCVRAS